MKTGLQELLSQIDSNDACWAAHASQVVWHNVGAHLEVIDDHCRQRGRGVEQAAVDHQDVNLHPTTDLVRLTSEVMQHKQQLISNIDVSATFVWTFDQPVTTNSA